MANKEQLDFDSPNNYDNMLPLDKEVVHQGGADKAYYAHQRDKRDSERKRLEAIRREEKRIRDSLNN